MAPPPTGLYRRFTVYEFCLLGPLEVRANGRTLELGGQKQRILLATLLLEANRVVSSDRLIEAIWGEQPTATAHKGLQVLVSQLRKLLGKERVVARIEQERGSANAVEIATRARSFGRSAAPPRIVRSRDGVGAARLDLHALGVRPRTADAPTLLRRALRASRRRLHDRLASRPRQPCRP